MWSILSCIESGKHTQYIKKNCRATALERLTIFNRHGPQRHPDLGVTLLDETDLT